MTSRRSAPRWVAALFAVVCAGWTAACASENAPGGSADSAAVTLVDAAGRSVAFPEPARRVISLVPSTTQTIQALGRIDVLAGRTDYDTASWVAGMPSVGGGLEPSMEAVVALDPDLVIHFFGEQDTRTPARLDELGIRRLAVRPDRLEDIYRTVDLVGRAIGEGARADALVAEIREGLAAASARVSGLPRVRYVYLIGDTPPWAAGPGTFIDDVLSLMGGDNAFADLDALYAVVSPEQLRRREIDVVLLSGGQTFDASLTPAARVEHIGPALDGPGPGVVEEAYTVGELLHGRTLR
jgi:iron complex transport system substrate-binding protein